MKGTMTFGLTGRAAPVAATFLVGWVGCFAGAAERRELDSIVAIVNDDVVLASELRDRTLELVGMLKESERNDPQAISAFQSQVLERLIVESIQLQEAELRSIEVDDETLTRAVTQFAGQNDMSLEEFIANIAAEGQSYRALRERVRRDITIERVQQAVVRGRVFIAERDIDEFIASPFFKEATEDEYRLGHILLEITSAMSPKDIAAVREKADGLVAELRAGADFAATAMEHSAAPSAAAGGDLDWRKESRVPSRFGEDLLNLELGAVADPVQDASGFHVVKMIDRRSPFQERSEQTHVRHILLSPSAIRSDEETRAAIEEIRNRIVAGEDFVGIGEGVLRGSGNRVGGRRPGLDHPRGFRPRLPENDESDRRERTLGTVRECLRLAHSRSTRAAPTGCE